MKEKKPVKIDINAARAVLAVVDKGLSCGIGDPKPGHMCVEAAVAYALYGHGKDGTDLSDEPECVADVVREFKIELNDETSWGSNKNRAKGLRRIAVAQLGSRGLVSRSQFESNLKKAYEEIFFTPLALSLINKRKFDDAADLLDKGVDVDYEELKKNIEEFADASMSELKQLQLIADIGLRALELSKSPGIKLLRAIEAEETKARSKTSKTKKKTTTKATTRKRR